MRFSLVVLGVSVLSMVPLQTRGAGAGAAAAKGVIARIVGPAKAASVIVTVKPGKAGENPSYKYRAKGGKVYISATTPVAACRGFYDYIRSKGLGMVGWRGPVVRVPARWPDAPVTSVTSPFKFNQLYNVVTAGYSFPYWNWKRWQRELDWLAMHGYNMILDPIATEAIAERVWKKLGLTQEEIDAFVCGPAQCPWHRMGNIAKVDGPLPPEWHKDQIALQHKILRRMKALGMTPVFQGFAGFVPHGMKRLHPNETYYQSHWNGGFSHERAPIYIMPESPLFAKILKLYIHEWKKEFGTGKYFLIDTFNELKKMPGKPGQSLEDIMRSYGAHLSKILANADPKAVWALQGWIFSYQRDLWKPNVVKALFEKVPNDKMLIFDMMGVWSDFDGYYGKPWILGTITNMGGRTQYSGNLAGYIASVNRLLSSNKKGNNVGNSNHSEGVETNAVLFEMIADTGWIRNIKLDEWLKSYCLNRYGACPDKMFDAWRAFANTLFKGRGWTETAGWQRCNAWQATGGYSEEFLNAALEFLSLHKRFKNSPFYRDDAVEVAAEVLSWKADTYLVKSVAAFKAGKKDDGKKYMDKCESLLLQADKLLASHSLHRLERWVGFARSHSRDSKLQAYYEENAKRIITSWGPPVNDYSGRIWSGLIRDFYVPRLKAWTKDLEKGNMHLSQQNDWEGRWLAKQGISKIKPYRDPAAAAYKIISTVLKEK